MSIGNKTHIIGLLPICQRFPLRQTESQRLFQRKWGSRGGLVLFIHKDFHYKKFYLLNHPKDLEYLAIKAKKNSITFNIVFVYNPPYNIISSTEFFNFLSKISHLPNAIIIGDLNAQNSLWGSDFSNQIGNNLLKALDWSGSFKILNHGSHTRVHTSNSCPDMTLASVNLPNDTTWEVLDDCHGSDHFPIKINIIPNRPQEAILRNSYQLARVNWLKFEESINSHIHLLDHSFNDIDLSLKSFFDVLNKAVEISDGKIPSDLKKPRKKPQDVIWWHEECSKIVDERRDLLKN